MGTEVNCPTPEELAEFIDGRLAKPARDVVTAHLSDCAACREVFAGAAEFAHESAQAAPASVTSLKAPRSRWPLAAAAGLVLAVIGVSLVTNFPWTRSTTTAADFLSAAGVRSQADPVDMTRLTDHGWPVTRGAGAAAERRAAEFRIGVLLVDTEYAIRSGVAPDVATGPLRAALRSIPGSEPVLAEYANIGSGPVGAEQARQLDDRTRTLLGSTHTQLGSWLSALKLAASASGASDVWRTRLATLAPDFVEAGLDEELARSLRAALDGEADDASALAERAIRDLGR